MYFIFYFVGNRKFEFGGDKYNDSWSDSGKFTDK